MWSPGRALCVRPVELHVVSWPWTPRSWLPVLSLEAGKSLLSSLDSRFLLVSIRLRVVPSSRGQRGMTHFFQVSKWSQDCRLGGHTWFLEICCLQHCGRLKVRRTGAAWLTALKDSFAGLERAVRGWGASRVRGKDWVGRSHRFCRTCCFRPKPKLLLLPRAAGQAPVSLSIILTRKLARLGFGDQGLIPC